MVTKERTQSQIIKELKKHEKEIYRLLKWHPEETEKIREVAKTISKGIDILLKDDNPNISLKYLDSTYFNPYSGSKFVKMYPNLLIKVLSLETIWKSEDPTDISSLSSFQVCVWNDRNREIADKIMQKIKEEMEKIVENSRSNNPFLRK